MESRDNQIVIDFAVRRYSYIEVWEDALDNDWSAYKRHYGMSRELWEKAKHDIFDAFGKMTDGWFDIRLIPDEYRQIVAESLDEIQEGLSEIYGRDVVLPKEFDWCRAGVGKLGAKSVRIDEQIRKL